ncbi:MAG: cytochrome c biogenesis protein ResB [Anaerolineae bacterium]|uniref:cytochrome c biogenesis protein ResB n=1 Tax=Candidatus Amarolinea dominans TaxID=3140696 RepID=UPI0031354009|nr:cytochrome c biogenesis protein ResB [Anaerolineae bacterium]
MRSSRDAWDGVAGLRTDSTDPLTHERTASPDRLTRLWRLAGSRRTFLLLVIPLILGLAVASALPQLPQQLTTASAPRVVTPDTPAYQRALQQLAAPYGVWGSVWLALGLFTIGQATWLRLVLAALAIHNLVRLADQYLLWINLRHPTPDSPLPPSGLVITEVRVPAAPATAADCLMAELRSRFRLVVSGASAANGAEPGASQRIIIHATRGAWGAIGNILSYLGPLLVMLALFVSEQGGWREQGINLAPGQTWQLRARPGITLEASDIGSTSHLTVTVGGQADAVSLGPEAAAAPRGLRLLSTGSGPALQVTVTDSNGRPLSLRPLTSGNQATQQTLIFDRAQIEQSLALPLRSQVLRLVYYASLPEQGYAGPVFLAQALTLGSETPVFSTFLQEHAQTAVTDPTTQDTFHFTATRYVQLAAIFDPGLPLALIGGLLTFMGLLLAQSQPPARAWAWLNGQADETAATLALLGSGPWTRAELAALQDALAGMVASGTPLHADTAPRAASGSDF